ncbi:MAG: bifunctional diaminohydroxyphosphoribosylaminopyrimidine deaminase/5-amino-6-(5-phosphoribosylamino)uracil reductase RibD [Calditrichaeota bacterium]|nr:bifunctional diaminohydroxyphosphoribosylaminopyrimidine deaminase/5-amino-6-(5-phosphoribosylamino)uracil reductase RibD [Calditrichota bacterium]
MSSAFSEFDVKMMKRCFRLAKRGRGKVNPNPMVGAVLVKNGKIIAEGYHRYFGGPHAEAEAFASAKEDAAGATLYCNLEPCCHTNKKTPPCTPLIISNKIKRVVVSNIDPNPDVSGKGLQQLREAGIRVEAGLLAEEGEELNRFFFLNMREKRSYVTLKIARSLNGFISRERTSQTWLTGNEAVRYVHRLRGWHDAVLVGSGTVVSDDPRLTVRLAKGRNPWRVVLSGNLNFSARARIFNDSLKNKTVVLTSERVEQKKIEILKQKGIAARALPCDADNSVDPLQVVKTLWEEFQIGSVLVEGGQRVFSQFVKDGLFDELILIQTPKLLSTGLPAFNEAGEFELFLFDVKRLGEDVALIYRKKKDDKRS